MNKCGTLSGYSAHRKLGETACSSCLHVKRAYEKSWRDNNPDKVAAKRKAWKQNNPEKVSEYMKQYFSENQEMVRNAARKRRALKLQNGHEPYSEKDVLEMYGDNCHICGVQVDLEAPRSTQREGWQNGLHIDHLVPLSRGGSDSLENVRPAHGKCNLKKHAAVTN